MNKNSNLFIFVSLLIKIFNFVHKGGKELPLRKARLWTPSFQLHSLYRSRWRLARNCDTKEKKKSHCIIKKKIYRVNFEICSHFVIIFSNEIYHAFNPFRARIDNGSEHARTIFESYSRILRNRLLEQTLEQIEEYIIIVKCNRNINYYSH